MSVDVMTQIWNSGLERDEKSILVSLADLGNVDGQGIYPSLEYTAWRTGYSRSQVAAILKECKKKGYISWGYKESVYGTNQYQIVRSKLPAREPWKPDSPKTRQSENQTDTIRKPDGHHPVSRRDPLETLETLDSVGPLKEIQDEFPFMQTLVGETPTPQDPTKGEGGPVDSPTREEGQPTFPTGGSPDTTSITPTAENKSDYTQPNPLLPATPGGQVMFEALARESIVKGRRPATKFETLAQRDKFIAAESALGLDQLRQAVQWGLEHGATSRSRMVDVIVGWARKHKGDANQLRASPIPGQQPNKKPIWTAGLGGTTPARPRTAIWTAALGGIPKSQAQAADYDNDY